LIATASKDGHVRIYKLTEESTKHTPSSSTTTVGFLNTATSGRTKKKLRVDLIADLTDHGAEVWRVEWNVTGTILSSSGDDGKVRLWKCLYHFLYFTIYFSYQFLSLIFFEFKPVVD